MTKPPELTPFGAEEKLFYPELPLKDGAPHSISKESSVFGHDP